MTNKFEKKDQEIKLEKQPKEAKEEVREISDSMLDKIAGGTQPTINPW